MINMFNLSISYLNPASRIKLYSPAQKMEVNFTKSIKHHKLHHSVTHITDPLRTESRNFNKDKHIDQSLFNKQSIFQIGKLNISFTKNPRGLFNNLYTCYEE